MEMFIPNDEMLIGAVQEHIGSVLELKRYTCTVALLLAASDLFRESTLNDDDSQQFMQLIEQAKGKWNMQKTSTTTSRNLATALARLKT
jgi:hypothetical protein